MRYDPQSIASSKKATTIHGGTSVAVSNLMPENNREPPCGRHGQHWAFSRCYSRQGHCDCGFPRPCSHGGCRGRRITRTCAPLVNSPFARNPQGFPMSAKWFCVIHDNATLLKPVRRHQPRGVDGKHDHILRPAKRCFARSGKVDVHPLPRKGCPRRRLSRRSRYDTLCH